MKIQWLGHSCFKLEESTGTTVVTDPYDPSTLARAFPTIKSDVVTISHAHHDHSAVQNIAGNPQIISEIGSWNIKGVGIESMLSHHDSCKGKKRGQNNIFKFRMDGVDLCHLGDVGEQCSAYLSEAIGTVNVLLVPVGGKYTIDAEQAKEYIDFLMPDVVIPMHFKSSNSLLDIDKLDDFLELFDEDQITKVKGDTIELVRGDFQGDSTKIIVFETK